MLVAVRMGGGCGWWTIFILSSVLSADMLVAVMQARPRANNINQNKVSCKLTNCDIESDIVINDVETGWDMLETPSADHDSICYRCFLHDARDHNQC